MSFFILYYYWYNIDRKDVHTEMKVFGGRKFALFAFVFIIVSFLCAFIPSLWRSYAVTVSIPLGILTLVFAVFSRIKHIFRTRKISDISLVISVVLISSAAAMLLCSFTVDKKINIAKRFDGEFSNVVCTVEDTISSGSFYSYYKVNITEINGEKVNLGARAEFDTDMQLDYGYIASGKFEISLPQENLYGYPLREAYIADGVYLVISSDGADISVTEGNKNKISSFIRNTRDKLRSTMSDIFDVEDG